MNKITRSLKSSISVKNPFQTPVGRFIEHLTESNSPQEIQDGLSHLYHEMNESDSGPKHAAKALRFRMTRSSPLAFKTLLNTLMVLEGCMKHCGRRFHQHVAKKTFLADYGHLILPKYGPAEEVRQRAIALLQSWLEMFSGQPELTEFERFYQELQADVSLSMPSAAPIRRAGSDSSLTAGGGPGVNVYSPPREPSRTTTLGGHRHSHSQSASRNRPGSAAYPVAQYVPTPSYYSGGMYYAPQQPYAAGASSGPPMSIPADVDSPSSESSPSQPLSPEKVAKLNHEIDTVLDNASILGELIANNNPGHESADDFQLMTVCLKN
jgi:hypothetical protein